MLSLFYETKETLGVEGKIEMGQARGGVVS
jgi:hypothetical protein